MLRPLSMIGTLRLAIGFVLILKFVPSRGSSKQRSTATNTYPQPLHGTGRDPFVQNAPLVIAVACRDGVVVVAATEPSSYNVDKQQKEKMNLSIKDSEPLMYYNADEIRETSHPDQTPNNDTVTIEQYDNGEDDDNDGYPFLDLPDTFAGPYRIQSVASSSSGDGATLFVSCGWKVDGYIHLRNAARDIFQNERNTFGDTELNLPLFANQLSLYMAQCAVSERFRALSCTALIGGISCDTNMDSHLENSAYGCLWFIDVTGAYPVRAHCMGGGTVSVMVGKINSRELQTMPLADYINQALLYQFRRLRQNEMSPSIASSSTSQPFFNISTDEALIMILDLLSLKDQRSKARTAAVTAGTLLPPKTRLELVCIKSSISNSKTNQRRRRMIRKRISDIWGMKKKRMLS